MLVEGLCLGDGNHLDRKGGLEGRVAGHGVLDVLSLDESKLEMGGEVVDERRCCAAEARSEQCPALAGGGDRPSEWLIHDAAIDY